MIKDTPFSVTCISPINIAIVKYWGKLDEKLIIPANDNMSMTVSKKALCSETTVTLDPNSSQITLNLNGKDS